MKYSVKANLLPAQFLIRYRITDKTFYTMSISPAEHLARLQAELKEAEEKMADALSRSAAIDTLIEVYEQELAAQKEELKSKD